MATLATETWTGTTGANWPVQWTTGGTGTVTIQSNAGRQVAGASAIARSRLGSMTATSTFDITLTVQAASSAGRVGITVGTNQGDYYMLNGYMLELWFATGDARINTTDGTGVSTDRVTATSAVTGATTYNVRFQRSGGVVRAKVYTGTEPGTWLLSWTDTVNQAAGILQLGTIGSSTITYDDLTVLDAAAPAVTVNVDVSGSGTLTATAVHVAAGAVSGSGTLTATATHVADAGLTGSGTLSVTTSMTLPAVAAARTGSGQLDAAVVPRLTVTAALSGSGTLSYSISGPPVLVQLSSAGQLYANTKPGLTVAAALTGSGGLNATTSWRPMSWIFHTPTREMPFRMAGRGLIASQPWGLTVYRVGGQWRTGFSPTPAALDGADRVYAGGYANRVSVAERDELIAAGFTTFTYEETS